jgi:hypothetical protein
MRGAASPSGLCPGFPDASVSKEAAVGFRV